MLCAAVLFGSGVMFVATLDTMDVVVDMGTTDTSYFACGGAESGW